MEALVIALAALVALVLIDAGYWIAVSLMHWSPVPIVGAAIGRLADREGLGPAEAFAVGALVSAYREGAPYPSLAPSIAPLQDPPAQQMTLRRLSCVSQAAIRGGRLR